MRHRWVAMRWIALLLLLAVLPTAELAEQVVHVAAHALHLEAPDHSAHHGEHAPDDEHGCTGLMHLCGHVTQVTTATSSSSVVATLETPDVLAPIAPAT